MDVFRRRVRIDLPHQRLEEAVKELTEDGVEAGMREPSKPVDWDLDLTEISVPPKPPAELLDPLGNQALSRDRLISATPSARMLLPQRTKALRGAASSDGAASHGDRRQAVASGGFVDGSRGVGLPGLEGALEIFGYDEENRRGGRLPSPERLRQPLAVVIAA